MNTHQEYLLFLSNEEETLNFGKALAKCTRPGSVIFLDGVLGAGKTTITRGFLQAKGHKDKVKSPTYTLVEPYVIEEKKIFHFDLYRLSHSQELEYIGIEEYFTEDAISIIEWAEKGFPYLPQADLTCTIMIKQQGREVKVSAFSSKGDKMLKCLSLE